MIETLPDVNIVNVSAFESATNDVPFAIIVLNARLACPLALSNAADAAAVLIDVLVTDVRRPRESTVNTGTIVAEPYVAAVTPVVVKSNVILSPVAFPIIETLPDVNIVSVSAFESATNDVPFAITVLNDSCAAPLAFVNEPTAARLALLALSNAADAIVVLIVVLVTDVIRPLESTLNTGTIVLEPYVAAVTPVVVKSNVILSPVAFPIIETLPVVSIVNVSAFEFATNDVPFAITVLNARLACALALANAAVAIDVSIVAFATVVRRPLESTVNTGTIVAEPYVAAVTPVVVKSNVILSPAASAVIETFPVVLIVKVSALEVATSDVPFADTVLNGFRQSSRVRYGI